MTEPVEAQSVGVRWQRWMEEALGSYRERAHVLSRMSFATADAEQMQVHATAMQAHATAALALVVANSAGDVELQLSRLVEAVDRAV